MSVSRRTEILRLKLKEPFFAGLGVCAHDNSVTEQAIFSNVEIRQPVLESTPETIATFSIARVIYHVRDHIEAPNLSRDGQYFLSKERPHLHDSVDGGEEKRLTTTPGIDNGPTILLTGNGLSWSLVAREWRGQTELPIHQPVEAEARAESHGVRENDPMR